MSAIKEEATSARGDVRTQLRLPPRLHIWLRQHCKQNHRSMNGQIVEIIESAKRQADGAQRGVTA